MKLLSAALVRLLIAALLLLSARTPSIASISPFGGDGKQPKPGKKAPPAATARALVQSLGTADDGPPPAVLDRVAPPPQPGATREDPLTTGPVFLWAFGSSPPHTGPAPPWTAG